jgi:[ribosomal protein S5]-alanine N-acetyltransferase
MKINRFSPFPVLHTERLTLRQLRNTDWPDLLLLRSDPSVNKYIFRAKQNSREEMVVFIERINSDISAGRSVYWVICSEQNFDLIGTICLWNFSDDEKTAELGYELFPAHQKKGYMKEALAVVLTFGFGTCLLTKMEAYTHKENLSSKNLLKHFNFRLVESKTDSDNLNNEIYELKWKNY